MIPAGTLLISLKNRLRSMSKFSIFTVFGFFILITILINLSTHQYVSVTALNRLLPTSDNNFGNDVVNSSDPRVNSTLGFGQAVYMNLENRWDLDDAITLQSAVSEIDLVKYNAVPVDYLSREGMPLGSENLQLYDTLGVVSCFATHAKLWNRLLESNDDTSIIFEADAAWDVEFRRQLGHFSNGIYQLLVKLGKISPETKPTNADPFLHKHWDIIQFGGCFESELYLNLSTEYDDPYAQKNQHWVDKTPLRDGTRMIRERGEQMCSTSYAISRLGAEKLLLRGALDFNTPVDGIISEMVRQNIIRQYTVIPMPVIQWKYIKQLAVNSKSSELNNLSGEDKDLTTEQKENAWKKAHDQMSVWEHNAMHKGLDFRNPALFGLKNILYSDE